MAFPADPGGVFETDVHRRVLGHLNEEEAQPLPEFELRIGSDQYTQIDSDEISEVLSDLEASGYAKSLNDGWKLTKRGHDALTANPDGEEG
jgi:hypothetical protein